MPIVYDKLFKRLKAKGITTYKIKKENIIGQATLYKLKNGGYVDTRTIERLCEILECQPGDLMEYISNKE